MRYTLLYLVAISQKLGISEALQADDGKRQLLIARKQEIAKMWTLHPTLQRFTSLHT